MRWIFGVGLACLLSACAVTRPTSEVAPRPVIEVDQWRVLAGDRFVGRVVLLEIQDPRSAVRFYQVRNPQGQWLGYVDSDGRVFQRVPFAMDEKFRGIHPMEKGLALLYEESAPLKLVPAQSGIAEATGRKNP